jgi:hypothetical protein
MALIAALSLSAQTQKKEPVIPIGLDAYRQWERWPEQRIGMRAYMLSTYDRSGGNEGADASHFLYQLSDNFNVSMDVEGPGMLVFARFNHWHGSPWHFVVDGKDNIVEESSTRDPLHPLPDSMFLPQSAFPAPLNETWATTKGADLIWSPVPFERSFQMAYSRTHYGTGYYIVDRFVPGTALSHPLKSWTEQTTPDPDVLDLIQQAGSDIAPAKGLTEKHGAVDVPASGAVTVAEIHGKDEVRALSFTISREQALAFSRVHLRVTWDGRADPSIDAPIALFYGAGILYNRDNREYLVKAFPVNIRYAADKVVLACYFPMPFFRSAKFELAGDGQPFHNVSWQVRYEPLRTRVERSSYFHATYRDVPRPVAGEDLTLLDTREAEGGGNWSGSFVGTSFIFSHDAQLTTLEGDPRFFFDDSLTPQAQGTGTEEWGGGGDYWGGSNMTLAFAGHPVGARDAKTAVNADDKIESAYRFLLADLFPFGRNAVIRLEHGGTDESTEHYETVAFWYGLPSASLIKTDELQTGDAAAERAHGYQSPEASQPYSITSRYEWGVDTLHGQSVYPAQEDRGRVTTGTSEFRMQLNSDNQGVLLRRKLDYKFANQRAEVSVEDEATKKWLPAGIWYLAGSNTCVYSNPKDELSATQHIVQTSNRRFRDDEFLIPRKLTAGRKSIRIRILYTPVNRPLYPRYLVGEQGWSEIKYTAYSFVVPSKTW